MRGQRLGSDKPHRRNNADTAREFRFVGASELEAQVAAARRELAGVLNDYRELGLRVSLLTRQRNVALRNLARTEQYLESANPGFKPLQPDQPPEPQATGTNGAPAVAQQASVADATCPAKIRRKPRWRRAVRHIAAHTVPAMRLQREFSELQQQLVTSRGECQRLEQKAERLARERDEVVAELERARAEAFEAVPQSQRLAELEAQAEQHRAEIDSLGHQLAEANRKVESLTGTLLSVEETLERVQAAKNDLEIGLIERDDRVAVLETERGGLEREIDRLNARLSELQQDLATTQESSRVQASELDGLREELARAHNRDAERIEELEAALADAASGLRESEKRRRAQTSALQEQMQKLDERHRQLAALETQQHKAADEVTELKRCVSAAEQSRARAQQEAHSRKAELDELVVQLKSLQSALESAEARVANTDQQRQALSDALVLERGKATVLEQQLGDMRGIEEQLSTELTEVTQRLSVAQDELASSSDRNQSLKNDMDAVVHEYAATRRRDREELQKLEHRLTELEPQLAAAHKHVEELELSLAESAYRQEVSDRQLRELGTKLELERARQSAEPAAGSAAAETPEPEAPASQTLPAIRETKPPALVIADAVPLRQRRRRRWAGAAAAAVVVVGVVAGAVRLRDFIWGEQSVAEPENVPERSADEQPGEALALAEPEAAASLATAEIEPPGDDAVSTSPSTPATEGKTLPPYLQSLSREAANDQGQEPENEAEPDGTAQTGTPMAPERVATIQSPADSSEAPLKAARKRAKLPPYLQSLSRQARQRKGTGEHVEAHLMREATSARALSRLCEGDGGGAEACSETEKGFMKDTVIGLPSGVKYKVITNGTGRSPQSGDTVVVNYRGLLPDGTEFDSGGPGGEEAFRLSQAIPGLRDVLPYMEEGAKWEVYLPTELAFPEPGPLGGQEVIFTIELLAVVDPETAAVAAENPLNESAVPARTPGSEESYWQSAKGGEADGPETESAFVAEPRRFSPLERRTRTEDFLAENAEQEDVVSLPSGLQYRVLKDGNGSGRSPGADDTVVLNYRGILTDGREFDRSEGATEFSLAEVIPGWREALQHMEEGAQWEVVIPPSLTHRGAVRKRGAFGQQPLIYEIELVSINESGHTTDDR
jgi:FKBP-type peptidyl-prolyl cis-trans isomerase/uncharacterized coiled-coil protein SlyX